MLKNMQKKNLILSIIILCLVLVVIISGIKLLHPTVLYNDEVSTKTIERNGKKYFPRQDITTFLIMGIDREGIVEDSGSYNNDGEADVVVLAIFDESDKTYTLLCLNRDTMLEMPVLGIGGKPAGTAFGQLALSHTYGSGLEDSCENTKTTISNFLYGLEIDYYVAMNMDAIGILNDAVGGVTVNVTDDFSSVDSSITKGKITLSGDQALTYIRTRKGVGDQMNISRMKRHEEYMKGFFDSLGKKIDESDSFAAKTFNKVFDYIVTDCSADVLATYTMRYSDYTFKEIVSPKGENVSGKEFMEFYVDETELDNLILRLFYAEK